LAAECVVVVPLHNEEENLPKLHVRLTATLKRLAIPYEIIYVDNGSTDQTPALIEDLHRQDDAIRGIILSRRFSPQAVLSAGLEAACGRSVITIDGNLEDPPEVLPLLIETWHAGYEVVFARRRRRTSALHRAASIVCRGVLKLVSEVPIPTDTGDMVLMDQRVVTELNSLPERTRFLTGLRGWVGFRQTVLEYDHHPRLSNRAVPILSRQIRTVLEALFSFSKVPLKTITVAGLAISALAVLSLFKLVGANLTTSNAVTVLLAGVQLICLGIVGEYVSRIYSEVRGRPLYVVRQRIGFQPLPRAARNIVQFLPSEAANRQETATRQRLQSECPSGLIG